MAKYLLGLDNGGTMVKAAVFTPQGTEIAVASRQTPLLTPKSGYTERDMDEMWANNCECIKEAIAKAAVNPKDVAGVAVCGHGKGLYAWGKNNKPAYHGIVSTDNRAWQYPQKWKESGVFDAEYPKLCQQIMPCQQLSLLAWLKDNEKSVYDNIQWAFGAKDYVRYRLTGEAFSEATDISGSGLLNVRDAKFDRDMLAAFGIAEVFEKAAPLKYSAEGCGKITAEAAKLCGLMEGTPVAGGMFDIDSCAIAMSITAPEQLCTITGTWSINEFISTAPILHSKIAMNSLYAIPGFYLLEECSATGAGNLEWVIQNCLKNEPVPPGKKLYAHIDDLVAAVPIENCEVYFLPFLYGSNRHPLAKATFAGLTSFHTTAHMLRAVFEGAAFSAKSHIDKLLSVRKKPVAIRLAGGAANSKVWVQMFADILDTPIETVTGVKELGALGCAMAASIAAGIYADYNEAAANMVRISPPVTPSEAAAALYQPKYEKYTAICEALDTVWHRFEV